MDWEGGLQNLMLDYFNSLFASTASCCQAVVNCIDSKILNSQNVVLMKSIEYQEVKQAIFHMHSEKSPGPDGMSLGFYHKYWQMVGGDVIQMVKHFFVTGRFEEQYTDTNIVLIPKKKNPQLMTDLRPISLCNVRYKIASKVLEN